MLRLVVALAFVALAYSQESGYNQVQYRVVEAPKARNIYAEVAQARSRVYAAGENDVIINSRLDGIMSKIDAVNAFRAEFESETLGRIEAGMDAQDARIRSIREQIFAQFTLVQDVETLQAKVDNILADLEEFRTTRITILSDIRAAEDTDIVQNQQISDLETQVQVQDGRIAAADASVSANEAKADEVYGNLVTVVNIVNSEASTSFDVELTAENPSVSFDFDNAFVTQPGFTYGITGVNVEDLPEDAPGYGGYGNQPHYTDETIYTQVNVEVNQNGGTASLVDTSSGWKVQRARVRISVFTTDNGVIEYQGGSAYQA